MIDNAVINAVSLQDLGFYLKWRELSAPTTKTAYEDIPGAQGALDTTEAFGAVYYEMRTIKLDCIHPGDNWRSDYERLLSLIHGKNCKIVFDSDPDYYWTGRVTISGYAAKAHALSMSATVYPFKLKTDLTVVTAEGGETVTLTNGRMPATPTVTNSDAVTLSWGEYSVTLSAGTHIVAGLELAENSETDVTVEGDGDVTFIYREGAL